MLENDRLVLIWDLLVHDRAVPGTDRRVQASWCTAAQRFRAQSLQTSVYTGLRRRLFLLSSHSRETRAVCTEKLTLCKYIMWRFVNSEQALFWAESTVPNFSQTNIL